MKLPKTNGLRPQNYIGMPTECIIVDVGEEERKNKKGEPYTCYFLEVNLDGDVKNINFLFLSDLKELIAAYGEDTDGWKQKKAIFEGVTDGEFFRWKLTA